jgi:PKD repeat protein
MKPGKYSITLTISKEGLSSIAEKENFIHVKPPYQPVKAFPDGKEAFTQFRQMRTMTDFLKT